MHTAHYITILILPEQPEDATKIVQLGGFETTVTYAVYSVTCWDKKCLLMLIKANHDLQKLQGYNPLRKSIRPHYVPTIPLTHASVLRPSISS